MPWNNRLHTNMTIYKTFAVLIFCVWVGFGARGRTEYTVQRVVDIPVEGRIWNLMNFEPVGHEVDYRVDTGTPDRVWSPLERFDFRTTEGDSVLQTGAETRAYRVFFSPGILRGIPDGSSGSGTFCLEGRIHQSRFVVGEGHSTVMPTIKGMLVGPSGDSIADATLLHDVVTMRWYVTADSLVDFRQMSDSLICTSTVDSYRIMAPYMEFPQAFKRVNETVRDGLTVSRDSMAWVMTGTPTVEMERIKRNLLHGSKDKGQMDGGDTIDDIINTIDLLIGGERIEIRGNESVTVEVVITDVLGRTYYEGGAKSGDRIYTSTMPRGEYLIQVIPSAGQAVVRKFVVP